METDLPKTEEAWKEALTPEQFEVLRKKGTERPFSGEFMEMKEEGLFACAGCGATLFSTQHKYDSGTGWPSFYEIAEQGKVKLRPDESLGMDRTEVVCANCGGHLGHLFDDGPADKGGKRYCINSAALDFHKEP